MHNIQSINTAVYELLAGDPELSGMCSVYKGAKRPGNNANPSVTIDARRLEAGDGEGIRISDIAVTVYADVLANRMADHETLDTISSRINGILTDAEPELEGAKALPLIRGECSGAEWGDAHDNETSQEITFGLVFVDFG